MTKPKPSMPKKPKSSGNIHDQFVRAVFANTELVAEFLKQYAAPALVRQIDLKRIKLESTHFFGDDGRERIADLIFSIPLKKGLGSTGVIFVFEHKSERRRSLGFQMLKYLVAIWNQKISETKNPEADDFFLPAPLLIVLHNGARPLVTKPRLDKIVAEVAGTEKFVPKFDYDLVDLPALEVEELGKAPLLRVILELLKRGTDGTLYDVRSQILEPLAKLRSDEKTRYWIQRILQYMDQVFKRKKKELTPKLIDQVIKPVYHERSSDMSLTFLEKLELKGREEGLVEGEAKGKAEGIITVLQARFKQVPKEIADRVMATTDLVALESLTITAATCENLDEFQKALK